MKREEFGRPHSDPKSIDEAHCFSETDRCSFHQNVFSPQDDKPRAFRGMGSPPQVSAACLCFNLDFSYHMMEASRFFRDHVIISIVNGINVSVKTLEYHLINFVLGMLNGGLVFSYR